MGTSDGGANRSCLCGGQLDQPPGWLMVSPAIRCEASMLFPMCVYTVRAQLSLPTRLTAASPARISAGAPPGLPSAAATVIRASPFSRVSVAREPAGMKTMGHVSRMKVHDMNTPLKRIHVLSQSLQQGCYRKLQHDG